MRAIAIEGFGGRDRLRQRRALREAGYDPDEAKVRDEKTVEGYLQ